MKKREFSQKEIREKAKKDFIQGRIIKKQARRNTGIVDNPQKSKKRYRKVLNNQSNKKIDRQIKNEEKPNNTVSLKKESKFGILKRKISGVISQIKLKKKEKLLEEPWEEICDVEKIEPEKKEKFWSFRKTALAALSLGMCVSIFSGFASYKYMSNNPELKKQAEEYNRIQEENLEKHRLLSLGSENPDYYQQNQQYFMVDNGER